MEQTIERVYRTKYQCCHGWQQLNGEMGCMFSKYITVITPLYPLPKPTLIVIWCDLFTGW